MNYSDQQRARPASQAMMRVRCVVRVSLMKVRMYVPVAGVFVCMQVNSAAAYHFAQSVHS